MAPWISSRLFYALPLMALMSCSGPELDAGPKAEVDEALSGGAATTHDITNKAFGSQVTGLDAADRNRFVIGNGLFRTNWVTAPASASAFDGLGPMLNAVSCGACHPNDSRALAPEPGDEPVGLLLRIGSADGIPDPVYGDQLQNRGIPGAAPEASVGVAYERSTFTFADGESVQLRRPHYTLTQWGYGAPGSGMQVSPRLGQQLAGLGLLEAVPEQAIAALADEADADADGISGRPAWLTMPDGSRKLGRFGWKAAKATLADQAAAAFANDMGITSPHELRDAATPTQADFFTGLPNGGEPELDGESMEAVRLYLQALAVPARRSVEDRDVLAGKALFAQAGCAKCHTPVLQTGASQLASLSNQKIRPYTDLLLHDMGPDLADGRAEGAASGAEWRTPPLWGLGLIETVSGKAHLLHDGRAETVEAAILWHGGEAQKAQEAYTRLAQKERAQLLSFLKSL